MKTTTKKHRCAPCSAAAKKDVSHLISEFSKCNRALNRWRCRKVEHAVYMERKAAKGSRKKR